MKQAEKHKLTAQMDILRGYEIFIAVNPWKDMDHCINYTITLMKPASLKPLVNKSNKGLDILEELPTSVRGHDYYEVLARGVEEGYKILKANTIN